MIRAGLIAGFLMLHLVAVAAPPDEAEMARHKEKAEQWAATKSCDQIIADLRGWFGRLFEAEPMADGRCDIYVVHLEWQHETQRVELLHRFRIASVQPGVD